MKSKFLDYYKNNIAAVKPPMAMTEREFGFLLFRERIMVRHKAFQDFRDFADSLLSLIPSDVYYSTAYYRHPDREMDQKGWLGSDVVFDVDADHIDTPCKEAHDMWLCPKCKETRRGKKPVKCPKCGNEKLDEKAWLCDRCLIAAREEVLKLVEFLSEDFGIKSHDMHLFFSGHRGYHLHLISENLKTLDEIQRKELVDYVIGLGLDPAEQGLYQDLVDNRHPIVVGPELTDPGWRGRLARGVYQILTESDPKQLMELGFTRGAVNQIVGERERIKTEWSKKMLWSSFQDKWRINEKIWRNIVEKALTLVALPAKIDTVVTTDIHRLIRMPETLNGKTGFRAAFVDLKRLEDFDPFTEPVAFEGTQKVFVKESPEIRIRGQSFGPFVDEKVELPLGGAVLLIAKGVALPVN
ncbi:MAG: DNA primase small subunit domain-containing protein [Candidatus Bathyarchaeia archaeon]